MAVTPELNDTAEPPPVEYTAHDGTLVIHASNLSGPNAVGGVKHAWPQTAEVDLYSTVPGSDCGGNAYLDSRQAGGSTTELAVRVMRSGTVTVSDVTPPSGGIWRIVVVARSPRGVLRQTTSVAAKRKRYPSAYQYDFSADLYGFTNLRDFTSVTVTASKAGKHRTWLTLSRTP